MINYYKTLGLEQTATKEEIKKKYRKLAFQFHPDKNPNNKRSEEEFKKIQEAYENLSEDIKKAKHDNELQQEYIRLEQLRKQKRANQETERKTRMRQESIVTFMRIAVVVVLIVVVSIVILNAISNGNSGNSVS